MSLKGIAKDTLAIIEAGTYCNSFGVEVQLRAAIDNAAKNTVLYRPEDVLALDEYSEARSSNKTTVIEVTNETTAQAARRLIANEHKTKVAALNFASARNPGGGFLGGAKAQEEDLSRCSALYTCLITQPAYYVANRAEASLLYTDHIIYSPEVPFFRDDSLNLLDEPFLLSIITAPAPNAGEVLRKDDTAAAEIGKTLRRRSAKVLSVAAKQSQRVLVLGAWGCGVFRNDPAEVADCFANLLQSAEFKFAFEQVTFAVFDRSEKKVNLSAFEERFAEFV